MIRVVNASADWSWEQIEPYVEPIKAMLGKLQKRFPDDLTVQSLINEAVSGSKCLWVILDDDRLMATAMTQIKTLDATGKRVAILMDLAGENVPAWASELGAALEAWGDSHNVDIYAVEGREGWGPIIEKLGYRKYASLWRKPARKAA